MECAVEDVARSSLEIGWEQKQKVVCTGCTGAVRETDCPWDHYSLLPEQSKRKLLFTEMGKTVQGLKVTAET